MSIKRVDYLVSDVREETDNPNTADTKDGTIVSFLNRAQDRLMSLLTLKDESFMSKSDYINLVSGTISYALPTDMLVKNRIISVEWSLDTNTDVNRRVYTVLKRIQPNEQPTLIGYFIQQGNIIISPVPTQNITSGLRINYVKKPYTLDIRRGTITSLTPLTIGSFSTSPTETLANDLLTIVNATGTPVVTNIANGGFNSGTGVITTSTSVAAASIGQYVLLGGTSTTHCELPDLCERYLIEYAKLMLNGKDSSNDAGFQSPVLQSLEQDILDLFANNSMDTEYVPIVNTDYMGYD